MLKHALPKRQDVDTRHKWHIEDYYADDSLWEKACLHLDTELPELAAYSGHLEESAATLLACLEKNQELSLLLDQLYTYANMRMHEDSANAYYQGLASRAESMLIRYSAAVSFLVPEILAMPEETLGDFESNDMKTFNYTIISLITSCGKKPIHFPPLKSICWHRQQNWAAHRKTSLPCSMTQTSGLEKSQTRMAKQYR